MSVVIETTIGDFTVDLFTEERPQTCRNFLKLCKIKYYNWHLFHTVQSNFIAQTGDPTGTGKGGESVYGMILGEKARYYEAEQMPKIKHDRVGLLSMVNCGDNMLGSQFFITLDRDLQSLDGEHCVFGEIAEGLEIILKFNDTICDGDHRPYQDIRISHTVILDDPYDDPENLVVPDRSPEPTKEALMSDRIGADEALDDTAGMTMEEITEMRKDKEAKAAATILEIVGDIPDADIAPPENVLFVCKLNPVTNDDDLEIIFSRFGKIVGCEVIRDRQTGDSLQYAFIEFADRKSCEDAYFKMDNVLIDDRRIHVDFSQSVSKMRWKGKGRGFLYNNDERTGSRKIHEDGRNVKSLSKNSQDKSHRARNNPRNNRDKYDYEDDASEFDHHKRKKDNNKDDYDDDNDFKHKNGKQHCRRENRQVRDGRYNKSGNTRNCSKTRSRSRSQSRARSSRECRNTTRERSRSKSRSRSRSQNRSRISKGYRNTNRERSRSKSRSRDRAEQMKDSNKSSRSRQQKDRNTDKEREKKCSDDKKSKDRGVVVRKHKKRRSRDKSVEKVYKKRSSKKDRRN